MTHDEFGPPEFPDYAPPRRRSGWSLRVLLVQYNNMLGWDSNEKFARALGRDTGWVSRIFNGKQRPTNATLELIADTYHRHGLTGITVQQLAEARDRMDDPETQPYGIPVQWRRLVMAILALPEDVQDRLFAQMSLLLTHTTALLRPTRIDAEASNSSTPSDYPHEND